MIKQVQDSRLNDLSPWDYIWLLTQHAEQDEQGNRRVQEANGPNVKSAWGCAVQERPRSGPGQLLALAASVVPATKGLDSVWGSIG